MQLNTIRTSNLKNHRSGPPAARKNENQPAPVAPDLSDAYAKDDQKGLSFGSLALLGMGAAAVVTSAAYAQPVEAAELDLAKDEVSSVEVDLQRSQRLLGGTKISGEVGGQENNLQRTPRFLGGEEFTGTWNGKKVDLDMTPRFFGGYNLEGSWGGQKVDLEIKPSWADFKATGEWGGQTVNVRFDLDWQGNFDIDGTWRGKEIDVNVKDGFVGGSVDGTYGKQNVNLDVSGNWFGSHSIEGESPEEAVFPFLLSNRLSEIRAENADSNGL